MREVRNRGDEKTAQVRRMNRKPVRLRGSRVGIGLCNRSGVTRKEPREIVSDREDETGWWVGEEWCHRDPKVSAGPRGKMYRVERKKEVQTGRRVGGG